MADKSRIEWTDATWNPLAGCSIVSPGCTNCYAMRMAGRLQRINRTGGSGTAYVNHYDGTTQETARGTHVWTGTVRLAPDHILTKPLRWKRPRRIFVNSMSDLFHESVPDAWIDRVFAIMALCPQHTFQVLTKRARRMREYLNGIQREFDGSPDKLNERFGGLCSHFSGDPCASGWFEDEVDWPLPNAWLGVSCEDQRRADERIPELLATPAAIRWVSAEPLLGPIYFDNIAWPKTCECADHSPTLNAYDATVYCGGCCEGAESLNLGRLDWIVAGGESGPGARPMHPDWVRSIRDQCDCNDTAFSFKQWGEWQDADTALDGITLGTIMDGDKPWQPARPLNFNDAETVANVRGAKFEHHSDVKTYLRLGKRRAGRLLDGVLHDAYPVMSGE